MNKLLETLYRSLYTPLEQAELQSEISSCHHQLTERLGKPEHITEGKDFNGVPFLMSLI